MSSVNIFSFLFFLIIFHNCTFGQSSDTEKIAALNQYVNFSNESTHGLLIVHRLLENFNKNINKVDGLPDKLINFYSNEGLPIDIFEDAENWFYDISPNEWYNKINESSGVLPSAIETKLIITVDEMKSIISALNNIRFELKDQISAIDFRKRENLSLVYNKLEEGVKLYKSFYSNQLILEKDIHAYVKTLKFSTSEMQFPVVLDVLDGVYNTTRTTLNALYNKDDDNFSELLKAQENAANTFEAINLSDYNSTRLTNSRVQMYWENIKRQNSQLLIVANAFADSEDVPEEYDLYDKYYYYYNIAAINKFNRYGNGIVFEMNRIIDNLGVPVLRYFEMPHYFSVIRQKE